MKLTDTMLREKKPDAEDYILCDSTYANRKGRQNESREDRCQSSDRLLVGIQMEKQREGTLWGAVS